MRGGRISYVPQDPASSLNPSLCIRTQLREILERHEFGSDRGERDLRLREVLDEVKLPSDSEFLSRYPHQLSGGQQQRVALAMAFACRPAVVVLDEPTTGLDVTTQAHVLDTVNELATEHRTAAVYVSHDLAVVAGLSARIAVMYTGLFMEVGPSAKLVHDAAHPYTRRLIEAAQTPSVGGNYLASPAALRHQVSESRAAFSPTAAISRKTSVVSVKSRLRKSLAGTLSVVRGGAMSGPLPASWPKRSPRVATLTNPSRRSK